MRSGTINWQSDLYTSIPVSPNVLPETKDPSLSFTLYNFLKCPRLRQETLVLNNSMLNRSLRTAYVLLPGNRNGCGTITAAIAG
jgi:hypothetical protein